MGDFIREEERENWGSRAGFVLAAIGSAVGLGNLWGFPYKVYDHGGGAFLVPYVLAMAVIGIPLLILEFSLGHMTQRAAPDAFGRVNRKMSMVGWWGIILSFVIITYYAVVLAWCLSYLWVCVKGIVSGGSLPWSGEGLEGVNRARDYFLHDYLDQWKGNEGVVPWKFGRLVGPIVVSLFFVWLLMYLCIFKGVKVVSKVVLLTVPLPWMMLFILTIRGLTLPGATEGLKFYLEPDWHRLADPDTWRWAFGQMFFSMSLAFGVMITYASFLHRKSDINNNAMIIGLADLGTSFIAGVAVFSTLGAMAFVTRQSGHYVPVEKVAGSGPSLAFVAFPYALAQLPYAAWFGAVFFVALITLGIDSAFSITESVLASIVDRTGWNRNRTLIGMTVVGFLLGLVYCTRGGLAWLGAMDEFINSSWGGIAFLGLLEALVLGWGIRIGRLREHANERSDWKLGVWWDWIVRVVAPVILGTLFVWSLLDKASSGAFLYVDGRLQVPVLAGLIVAVAAPLVALLLGLGRSGEDGGCDRTVPSEGSIGYVSLAIALVGLAAAAGGAVGIVLGHPSSALPLAVFGGLTALVGMVVSAVHVTACEGSGREPTGGARLAAGLGTFGVGAAAGTILFHAVSRWGAVKPQAVPSLREGGPVHAMEPVSYAVLAGMLVLVIGGLVWCFYRAMRAVSERGVQPQGAEL